MTLSRLQIFNLRNLTQAELSLHPRLNLIYGENGSGKTSLLESIYLLGLGRSFRNPRPKPVINYASQQLTVYGELIHSEDRGEEGSENRLHRLGVEKSRNLDTIIRFDGKTLTSAAQLAAHLPVLSINANSFELVGGSAKPRRQLLDWLAFHVEPSFLPVWKAAQHCIKQRNSLLRRGRITPSELAPWDDQLVTLATKIDQIRHNTFAPFVDAFEALNHQVDGEDTTLTYRSGWPVDQSYQDVLAQSLENDIERGYTFYGPHRADIRIKSHGHNAADVLSRGQQKMLVCALIVAQGKVFGDLRHKACVYLVDDLPAELDLPHRQQLGRWLSGLNAQVLVTGVDLPPLRDMWPAPIEARVFHVERGQVSQAA